MMNIAETITEKLKASPYWTERTKENGRHISALRCPECGYAEGWTYKKQPNAIICNRKNNCGEITKTRELFPELYIKVEKEYPATPDDPQRPATVFLQMRGLSNSLKGLEYHHSKNVRKTGSGAVMFSLPGNNGAGMAWNGRLYNPPQGEGKTHNKGTIAGRFWRHPGQRYDPEKPIYVTEGIIDALSFWEMGHQAIAILCAGQDPAKVDLSEFNEENLVFAFDNDKTGHRALKKWKAAYPKAKAILPLRGDWNDLLLSGDRERVKKRFKENYSEYECQAQLALAETPEDYVRAFYLHHQFPPKLFTFNGCFYEGSASWKEDEKGERYLDVGATKLSNFVCETDHYQLNTSVKEKPVFEYHVKVNPEHGQPIFCTLNADNLITPQSLRKAFLHHCKALWNGGAGPTISLVRRIVQSKAPIVRQLYTVGLDLESNCYVFPDFMVNPAGEIIQPDKRGFFKVVGNKKLRPARYTALKPKRGADPKKVYELIRGAWGDKGGAMIAWTVGSWFVHRIKKELGFYPFLSLHVDTQTGKSTLARICNNMQCLEGEGIPMSRVNTAKGEIRKLGQVSGLFKALLESKGKDKSRFDVNSILTLYNDNPLQVRALKTADLQTVEIPFQSSLAFIQNVEPFKTKAQKERVVSIPFKTADMTPETTAAFNELIKIPPAELAFFFPRVMTHRTKIESSWFEAFEKARQDISGAIEDPRLTDNHALVLASHRLLMGILGIEHDLQPFIEKIGKDKRAACAARPETAADYLFDILLDEFSGTSQEFMEVREGDGVCWLHIPGTLKAVWELGYRSTYFKAEDLHEALEDHPAFIEKGKPHRFKWMSEGTQVSALKRAWKFDLEKMFQSGEVTGVTKSNIGVT